MKNWLRTISLLTLMMIPASLALAENEGADLRILHAKQIFNSINGSGQPIPKEILAQSNVIVIFPNLGKAGFLYAGRFGLGVVMVRNPQTRRWSAPAFMRISGGSFGFQAGGQVSELILVGKGNYKFDKFSGGPAAGASLTATAGWWGVHSEVGSGWESPAKMHWFSRSKGLFASASVDGNVMSYDQGATSAYYGRGVIAQDVLFNGAVRPSPTGEMLLEDIAKYEGNPQASLLPKISFAAPQENGKPRQIQVPSWMPKFGKK